MCVLADNHIDMDNPNSNISPSENVRLFNFVTCKYKIIKHLIIICIELHVYNYYETVDLIMY